MGCEQQSYSPQDGLFGKRRSIIMAKKQNQVDVLDQMHEATMIVNEQKKTMDSIRPLVEREIARELRKQKLPKNYAGEISYHGYTIRIQRRTIIQFMSDEK